MPGDDAVNRGRLSWLVARAPWLTTNCYCMTTYSPPSAWLSLWQAHWWMGNWEGHAHMRIRPSSMMSNGQWAIANTNYEAGNGCRSRASPVLSMCRRGAGGPSASPVAHTYRRRRIVSRVMSGRRRHSRHRVHGSNKRQGGQALACIV